MVLLGNRLHRLLQHAVYAVLHHDGIIQRFNMDVTGAALERRKDRGVYQPDDRTDVCFRGEALDRDGLVACFIFTDHVEGEAFGGFVQHTL